MIIIIFTIFNPDFFFAYSNLLGILRIRKKEEFSGGQKNIKKGKEAKKALAENSISDQQWSGRFLHPQHKQILI